MTAMRSGKGQAQFNETILVLFVVVIILILAIFIYYRYSISSLKNTAEDLTEEKASVLLAAITSMPEIRCSNEDCVDMTKAMAFNQVGRQEMSEYARVFGDERILIERIYPQPSQRGECTLQKFNDASYPENCDYWTIFDNKKTSFTNKIVISTPISIYLPEIGKYYIGKLVLETYR